MALTLLTRRDPFAEFDALIRNAFPVATPRVGVKPQGARQTAAFIPAADVVRDGEDALISIDAPGLDFERDISVELEGATLSIGGERRDSRSTDDESGQRLVREVRYGTFRRTFSLPEHVTADALSASYDAGVLTVRVAGAYAGTPVQKIAVTAGSPGVTVTVPADAPTVEADAS